MSDANVYLKMSRMESLDRRSVEITSPPLSRHDWRKRYAVMLAWSNPNGVSDDLLITKALLSSRWTVILSAARVFGADRVNELWARCRLEVRDDSLRRYGDMLMSRAMEGRFE